MLGEHVPSHGALIPRQFVDSVFYQRCGLREALSLIIKLIDKAMNDVIVPLSDGLKLMAK
jgi:hypothetical protein